MPSLQDIRQFNDSLVRLADEPAIIGEWGEEVEALPEPEEGLDTDLSSLLEDTGDIGGTTPDDGLSTMLDEPAFSDEITEDEKPDFSELLGDDVDDDIVDEAGAEPPEDLTEALPPIEIDTAQDEFPAPADTSIADEFPAPGEVPVTDDALAAPGVADEGGAEEEMDFSDFEALLSDEAATGTVDTGFDEVTDGAEAAGEPAEAIQLEDEPGGFEDAGALDESLESFDDATVFDEGAAFDEAIVFDEEPGPRDEQPEMAEPVLADGAPEFQDTIESDDEGLPFGDEDFTFGDESVPSFDEPDIGAETPAALEESESAAFEFTDEESGDVSALSDEPVSFEEPVVPDTGEPESAFDDVADVVADEGVGDEPLDEFGAPDAGVIDDFSLGDFGTEFGEVGEEGGPSEEDLNPALSVSEMGAAPPTGEFQLTDGQFTALRSTMSSLPLNLRLEVEGIVAEAKGTTEQVEELIRGLAGGQSPQEIATLAGRILGTQIRVPRSYEKRTGVEFEVERQSFAYQFRQNVLPILRLVVVAAAGLAILGLGGYHLVFKPLYGRSLYREGLALIREDQYTLGNQTFERAREVSPLNRWFYEYADAFADERQYTLAGEKYEQLLFGMSPEERAWYNGLLSDGRYVDIVRDRSPEKRGVLEYAELESETLGNYPRADHLLQLILAEDTNDYDGWLAVGDNNMRWADEVPGRYEEARLAYARLMDRHGQTTELLFRMLTYFVRTDDLREVLILKELFEADQRLEVEPARYAEMSGYLIDNGLLPDVEDMLFRAFEIEPDLPQIHYHLARYYRMIDSSGEEDVALRNALVYLEEANPLTSQLRRMKVDALTRVGENLYEDGLFVDAQEAFGRAIEEYEEGLRRRVFQPEPMFGRAYSRLGDIFYYVARAYDDAYRQFMRAEENGYDDPDLDYKQGFVLYRNGQFDSALMEFLEVASDPSGSTNALLWATANTYYERGNFFAAEAYYRELLEGVERQRDRIRTLLLDESPEHQSIIQYLIRVNNNLGVTLVRLSGQSGNPNHSAAAMIHLTEAIEYSENYRREPDTLIRSSAISMAYLNQREILYPTPNYSYQIYVDLPEDLDDLLF